MAHPRLRGPTLAVKRSKAWYLRPMSSVELPSHPAPSASSASGPGTALRLLSGRFGGPLAALVTAGLVALSLPTVEWGPLAFVAWLPLLLWLPHARSAGHRLRVGWLAGIAFQLVIFRWIPFTVTEMTSLSLPIAWGMCVVYALWHGLQIGLFALLAAPARARAARLSPALGPLAVAAVFVGLEWLWPVVFPWSVSHALWEAGPFHAIAAVAGVPGMTFTLVLPQVALSDALSARLRHAPLPRRPIAVAAAVTAVFALAGVAWWAHASSAEPAGSLRVAVVQPNYTLEEKKHADFAMRRRLLERFEAQLRSIPPGRFDLIVASEGAFPLYWRVDTPPRSEPALGPRLATRRIQDAIAEGPKTRAMIGGLRQVHDALPGEAELANSVVFFEPDGTIAGSYDKRLLVPFSETMPFSDLIPSLRNAVRGIGHLRRGKTDCRFDLGGRTAGCGICYETLFANETRAQIGDAVLLTNFTIDTWFGRTTAPRLHLASHSSRAVELGLPLVRSALTGISAVLDPTGRVLGRLELGVTGVLAADVPLLDLATPYRVTGPVFGAFTGLFAALIALLGLVGAIRGRLARRAARKENREPERRAAVQPGDGPRPAADSASGAGGSDGDGAPWRQGKTDAPDPSRPREQR